MSFWHIIRIISRKKWIIIGIVSATVLAIILFAPEPIIKYSAVTLMTPSAQAMRGGATSVSNVNDERLPDRNVILSNLVILAKSSEVKRRASGFLALPVYKQKERAPGLPAYKQMNVKIDELELSLDDTGFGNVLEIEPVVNPAIGSTGTISDIIAIKAYLPKNDEVMYIANAIGVAFMEAYRQKSLEDIRKYNSFLISGTQEAKKNLDAIEEKVRRYNKTHNLAQIDLETENAVASVASVEAVRNATQAEVSEASATLADIDRQLRNQPLVKNEVLPSEMNPKVEKLKQDLAAAENELREAALKYRDTHPAYQAIDARIKFLKNEIAKESVKYTRPSINELHNELVKQRSLVANRLSAARAKLAVLNSQVSRSQGKLSSISNAQKGLTILLRERQRASEEYNLFAGRLAQAKVADKEFEKYGSIIPYDWSQSVAGPIIQGPGRKSLALYGFILALIFSIAILVWLDSIDNRLHNRADAEKMLGLPIAGLIPSITGKDGYMSKLTHIYPLSPVAEAYRMLRTDLLFSQRDSEFKTLMVATGKPGQGATTTISNLAISLAQVGKRVILIDADMRRPSLHKFFNVSNETGLSTLLKGEGNPMDCVRVTDVENLILIPAGPIPLNAAELLASERMWEIVQQLKQHFDFVLFDTPSTIVFSDGQILASWLDAVLFVVSANQVLRDSEKLALEKLKKAKANIIASVINKMPADSVDSAYYYSHYYATDNMDASIEVLGGSDNNAKLGKGLDTNIFEKTNGTTPVGSIADKSSESADN